MRTNATGHTAQIDSQYQKAGVRMAVMTTKKSGLKSFMNRVLEGVTIINGMFLSVNKNKRKMHSKPFVTKQVCLIFS